MTIDNGNGRYTFTPVDLEDWRGLEQHPLCAAFPTMSAEEFELLRSSIIDSGLIDPIVLFEGKILDGWQCYRVCCEEDIAPGFEEFAGGDRAALIYVIAVNQRRFAPEQTDAVRAALTEVMLRRIRDRQR